MVFKLSDKKASGCGARSIICLIFSAVAFVFASLGVVYGAPEISFDSVTTPADNATVSNITWINVSISSSEELNQSFLEWGNGSLTNLTMANSSMFNWSYNISNLLAGRYNYTVWAENTTGNWSRSATRFVTVSAISGCQNLTLGNVSYILIQNVFSAGTCFNILANNITIDGAGHIINYSRSETGYAINSSGYNTTMIKNTTIVQGNSTPDSHAIYAFATGAGTIANNTIQTIGPNSTGIFLDHSSSSNMVYGNRITTSNSSSDGLRLNFSNSTTISNNNITVSGIGAYGIWLVSSAVNTISGGSISAQYNDYYLGGAGMTNNFTNTNFTSRNISFQDTASYFKYNNETSGSIWLTTNISAPANITRTLVAWSNITMQWNDTGAAGIVANYALAGLLPRTVYYIYNASGGFSNKSYSLTTDAAGASPSFNITLNGNTELIVDSVPNITVITPSNDSYYNSTTINALVLNITTNEPAAWCGVSLNGTQNITMNNSATNTSWNYTGISMPDAGLKNATFYCNDSRGNIGVPQTRYFTIDNTAPIILGITETEITSSSAIIGWNTSGEYTTGLVRYGPNSSKTLSESSTNSTTHDVSLSGLTEANHIYYYTIISCDMAGNCNTTDGDFRTLAAPAEESAEASAASSNPVTSTDGLSKKWPSITANIPETMAVSSSTVDVTQIAIKITQTTANVKLIVARVLPKPTGVNSYPTGKVYQYFSVTAENVTDAKVSSASISFKVNATWMSQNNIDSSSIILYRYSGGQWNALSTYPAEGSTAQYKKFLAITPGFSYFAIAVQAGQSAASQPAAAPKTNKTANSTGVNITSSSLVSNSTSQNNETLSSEDATSITRNSLIVFIVIIIALVVAIVFHEKLKLKIPAKLKLDVPKLSPGVKAQTSGHKYTFNPSQAKKAELVYKQQPKEEKVKYAYKPKK